MAALKNDGTIPYGSKVLTVGSSGGGSGGTTYVADNIELTRSTGAILRTNELGEPSGRVLYKNDVDSFTCTLQLSTTSTVPPSLGWETTVTFDATSGAEIWYLDKLGSSFTKDGETKVSATFVDKIV
jgi:hypothetical protein